MGLLLWHYSEGVITPHASGREPRRRYCPFLTTEPPGAADSSNIHRNCAVIDADRPVPLLTSQYPCEVSNGSELCNPS
jgi:hypothetical protein